MEFGKSTRDFFLLIQLHFIYAPVKEVHSPKAHAAIQSSVKIPMILFLYDLLLHLLDLYTPYTYIYFWNPYRCCSTESRQKVQFLHRIMTENEKHFVFTFNSCVPVSFFYLNHEKYRRFNWYRSLLCFESIHNRKYACNFSTRKKRWKKKYLWKNQLFEFNLKANQINIDVAVFSSSIWNLYTTNERWSFV